jgi:hypothetical protein
MRWMRLLLLVALLLTGCTGATSHPPGSGVAQSAQTKTPPLPSHSAPPSLADIRKRVTFPIFVPTEVPQGLAPIVEVKGEESRVLVRINYRSSEGVTELSVLNGPAGCCLDADPRKTGESIPLRGSMRAHYLPNQPQFGGPILWWQEAGSYIALSGPHLNKEELVRIAASMSATGNP